MILLKIILLIITLILFITMIFICGWISFALGPMRCSFPNACTNLQAIFYTIFSFLILLIPFVFLGISFKIIINL